MSKVVAICYLVFIWGCFISCLLKVSIDYGSMRIQYKDISESLCELSNIEYKEYVCVNDVGHDARHCYVGNATWTITNIANALPLIQKWDKGFIPSVGTMRKCWYYDEKISLTSPEILIKNKMGTAVLVFAIGMMIAIIATIPAGLYLESLADKKELHAKTN